MRPLVVANWKMHTNLADATVLATMIKNQLHEASEVDVVVCPPHVWLYPVAAVFEVSAAHIFLGAQDCYPEKSGALTGAVSADMLKDLCQYVIVGHSERREHFGETSEFINDKIHACLAAGMTPIVCVGEKKRREGSVAEVMRELTRCLTGISQSECEQLIIAYEPVWSISSEVEHGEVADADYAENVAGIIKKQYKHTRVIYGGSVNAKSASQFFTQPSIDGALVGAASLKANDFVSICNTAAGRT